MPQIDNRSLFNQPPRPLALVVQQPAAGTTEYVTDAGQTVDPVPVYFPAGVPGTAAATTAVAGSVKQAAAQANSTATDVAGLVTDFNALLAKLRTAGILAP